MTLRSLVSMSFLNFFVLVALMMQPFPVNANRGNSFGWRFADPNTSSTSGICASSVSVHGYKCQELEVKTEDGYILSLQRIPEGRKGSGGNKTRPPVILQHGVLADGLCWLVNSPEQNLPLILADNGFDVWITNARGTKFSKRHVSLDPSDKKFWDWSFDELAKYELPAIVDFVHNKTGQKVNYVGHSLGTLMALTSLSERRNVDKFKSVALLSPIAYLSHMKTATGDAAAKSLLGEFFKIYGVAEFIPHGEVASKFLQNLCAQPGIDCYDLMTAMTGNNCCLNSSTVDLFFQHEPQSTSVKNMLHLAQIVRYRDLEKFDYVIPDNNVMHYGAIRPPKYNLSNIPHDLPLFMSYGGQDALSDVLDVQRLLNDLKFHDVDKLSVQYVKDYAHMDFIMAVNAKDIVYNAILNFFRRQ